MKEVRRNLILCMAETILLLILKVCPMDWIKEVSNQDLEDAYFSLKYSLDQFKVEG